MRKFLFALTVIAGAMVAQPCRAGAILNSGLMSGPNTISDISVDRFLDSSGKPITSLSHVISVNDQIEGIAKFTSLNTNSFSDLGFPPGYQLNAYFKLTIHSFASTVDITGTTIDYATFTSGFGSNVLAKLFETDNAIGHKVNLANSAATSIANILAESHVFDVAEVGPNDFFFLKGVTAGETIGQFVSTLSANGDNSHLFDFGLTIVNNTGMVPFSHDASSTTAGGLFHVGPVPAPEFFDITGNGQLTSIPNGANTQWQVGSLLTANFAIIPEPASILSLSLGGLVLGLGLLHARYRRKHARA